MKITSFNESKIRKLHTENQIVIIADFRNINYDNEQETLQYKIASELGIDLYPICVNPDARIINHIISAYGGYDCWFIDKSLVNNCKRLLKLLTRC